MGNLFKHNFSPRPGPLVLIGLGLVILLVGLIWLGVDRLVIGRGSISLPARLAGLPLVEQLSGRPALTEIQRLHGQNFPLVDGAVAYYGDGAATVWVSSAWTSFLAGRQVAAMAERIAERNSPFSPEGQSKVEGVTIYILTGMSQVHYYFQLDREVVWLAITAEQAEQGLAELIRYFQQG
ncbi:MAG: hypothetical protein BroJett011_13420 [Chloroflexota bacterium]|nr:MAG: hypothetical protein BroJett011_13420 [Chloroflexota bacterium]